MIFKGVFLPQSLSDLQAHDQFKFQLRPIGKVWYVLRSPSDSASLFNFVETFHTCFGPHPPLLLVASSLLVGVWHVASRILSLYSIADVREMTLASCRVNVAEMSSLICQRPLYILCTYLPFSII